MSKLSDHLNNLNRGELSTRQISNMAAKQGVSASHVTLSRYLRGDHPIPAKRAPLEAFAIAFGVSVEPLIELGNQPEEGYPFELPAKAATLNEAERAAILQLIDVMVEAKKPAKSWRDNLPAPEDMGYHIGAPTPDGGEFRPDKYQDHAMLWDRYGKEWKNHYTLAANTKKPNDDIEEPWT